MIITPWTDIFPPNILKLTFLRVFRVNYSNVKKKVIYSFFPPFSLFTLSSFSFIHPLPRTAMCGQRHFVSTAFHLPFLSLFSLFPFLFPFSTDLQILLSKPTHKPLQEISRISFFFRRRSAPVSLCPFPWFFLHQIQLLPSRVTLLL